MRAQQFISHDKDRIFHHNFWHQARRMIEPSDCPIEMHNKHNKLDKINFEIINNWALLTEA